MVNSASISCYRGYNRLVAVAIVIAALLLLLLLARPLQSNRRRANQWPLRAELRGASDQRSSPSSEHSSSTSSTSSSSGGSTSSSSSSSVADQSGSRRFDSELRPQLSRLSSRPPQPLPAPRGGEGGGAAKQETAFTNRSDHGATTTKTALTSSDDYYRARIARTRAADVARDDPVERIVTRRNESSTHYAVVSALATTSAAAVFKQSESETLSVATVLAPLHQLSTSASTSIVRAGQGAPLAQAAWAATVRAKTTTTNDGHESMAPDARFIITAETTAVSATKADQAPTVYVGLEKSSARLGNRMFQYASGLALALRYGRRAILVLPDKTAVSSLDALRRIFRLSPLLTLFARPPRSVASRLVESGWGRYDAARFDNASTFARSVYTVGYFQSWRYFAPVADRMRREFALTADAQQAADSYFRSVDLPLRSEGSGLGGEARPVLVGVHVRRGDMLKQSKDYAVAPVEYLLKAIAHYRHKYAAPLYNVSFIFATDDRAWVHEFVAKHLPPDLIVRFVSLDVVGDMAVLSRCDHSIITSGTFGWWSAWLAGGDVVYYKDFIRPTSDLYLRYSAGDYYPPEWIGLTG